MTVLAHTLVLYKINPYLELRVSREILWSWYIVLMYIDIHIHVYMVYLYVYTRTKAYRRNSQVEYNLLKKDIMHYMFTVTLQT